MTTLALDLGTTFGYAFSDGRSGAVKLRPDVRRFLHFWLWLNENVTDCERIAFEDVKRHIGTRAAHVYGGFKALLECFAEQHGIALQPVSVQAIKRHAVGRANAKKPELIAAAKARGWAPTDDNHADALWLLDYALLGERSLPRNSALSAKRFDDRTRSKRR